MFTRAESSVESQSLTTQCGIKFKTNPALICCETVATWEAASTAGIAHSAAKRRSEIRKWLIEELESAASQLADRLGVEGVSELEAMDRS